MLRRQVRSCAAHETIRWSTGGIDEFRGCSLTQMLEGATTAFPTASARQTRTTEAQCKSSASFFELSSTHAGSDATTEVFVPVELALTRKSVIM